MTFISARLVLNLLGVLTLASSLSACSKNRKPDEGREKLVPEETQQEAGELGGEQEMMMDYNASPADQAAMKHENRTRPVKRPEKKKK